MHQHMTKFIMSLKAHPIDRIEYSLITVTHDFSFKIFHLNTGYQITVMIVFKFVPMSQPVCVRGC